jgi:hypothetical protein
VRDRGREKDFTQKKREKKGEIIYKSKKERERGSER